MKRFSMLILVTSLCFAGCASHPSDPHTQEIPVATELPAGTFRHTDTGYSGDLYVRGYSDIQKMNEPFCMDNCQTFNYVFFHVLAAGSDVFNGFMQENEGNNYTNVDAIGLGCKNDDGTIRYVNQSDELKMKNFSITTEEAKTILDSTKENPVTLKLTKLPLDGGTDAPSCYAHFTYIHIVAGD